MSAGNYHILEFLGGLNLQIRIHCGVACQTNRTVTALH